MESKSSFDVVSLLPALLRYARVLVNDPAEAEELVHEALVRAYERRSTYDDRRELRPWLFSILYNRFIDGYRRRQMEERAVETMRVEGALTAAPLTPDTQVHLRQIHQAFMRLPPAQRAVLHLVAVEGLSYQEAASALDIPIGTLMSRLSRARAALRQADEEPHPVPASPTSSVTLKLIKGSHDSE